MSNTSILILDTTYILPLFGIKVKKLKKLNEGLQTIWKQGIKGYEIYLPSVCLIEVNYKLIQEYKKTKNFEILKRYPIALPTLKTSKYIKLFNPYLDLAASQIALKLRHAGHSDMMDCWIAASTASLNGILITEDKELEMILKKIPETKSITLYAWNKLIDEKILI